MTRERARAAVHDIIANDLTDRRGLKQAWWEIDDDIQDEIRERWTEIILKWEAS